jgi:hypothetical protein
MGQVIAFRLRAQPKLQPPPDGQAQILFFTGVRYQHDDPDSDAPLHETASPEPRRGGGRKTGGHRRRRGV